MTNRERVLAALRFETPDYIPYQVGFTGQMHAKMVAHTGDPAYRRGINNHITNAFLEKPQEEIRPEFFRDEYGVVWNRTGVDKDIGVIDSILIEETEDLDSFALPPVDEAFIRARMEALAASDPNNFRVACLGFLLFERGWTLRGMENLLCDMIAEPEFVHALFDRITDRMMQILDIALEYDFDCFHFGDDWGQQRGLIMGPTAWRTFIKPRMARLYARIHAAGKFVSQHSCGDLREIMDDLAEIGLDIYQTFQPEIYGLDYAEWLYGKITVWGGVSTQRDLPYGTPDEVRAVTRDLLRAFPHGGLIAAPTHAIPGDVPPENVEAMLEVFRGQ
ncbi:MAG: uroporphyrinogen decarboxylase [Clostridia bacterium]|nr:uroporphyrinogen decarboxylase [Clostridia bacterium]